jgi:hypothetical protein
MNSPPNPTSIATSLKSAARRIAAGFAAEVLRPIQGFRLTYLPLTMVYFAYGALGLIDVARDFWVKERLTLSAAELAGIGVWLNLPWTIKMVFGELVDSVPIFGSQRRSYIVIGAGVTAAGLLVLAGAAGGWLAFARPDQLYVLGSMLLVIGTVIQNVVAEAMSTEVVARRDAAGNARPEDAVRAELGMVQVDQPAGAVDRRAGGGWPLRLARRHLRSRDRVPHGARGAGDLGDRRAAHQARDQRAPACRLAHSRRRHGIRWRGSPARPGVRSVQPGADLRALDGGDLHDAGDRHARARQ